MNFKELRQQKNKIVEKLNNIMYLLKLEKEENQRLRRVLDMFQKNEETLHNRLANENNRVSHLTNRLMVIKRSRDLFYNKWMKDNGKINKWQRLVYISVGSNVAMVLFMILWSLE